MRSFKHLKLSKILNILITFSVLSILIMNYKKTHDLLTFGHFETYFALSDIWVCVASYANLCTLYSIKNYFALLNAIIDLNPILTKSS